jgi:response regulator RpfG family c-di-GMP phosphodiesterase
MDNRVQPTKILLAVRPADLADISDFLTSEFSVVVCTTMEEAVENLTDEIALIACGVRFDSGKMFELLDAVRANPATSRIPYYLLVAAGTNYSYAILEGIRRAAKVKGISGFINLSRLVADLGRDNAYERVRQGIRDVLAKHRQLARVVPPSFPDSMIGRRHLY